MMRLRVCSFNAGDSDSHSTTAYGSGSNANASSPKNNASMAAALMTVLPAPVGAARHVADRRPSSQ